MKCPDDGNLKRAECIREWRGARYRGRVRYPDYVNLYCMGISFFSSVAKAALVFKKVSEPVKMCFEMSIYVKC